MENVYLIRLAGHRDGWRMPQDELLAEARAIQSLLMNFAIFFLPGRSLARELKKFILEGRMLVLEEITETGKRVVGCCGYEIVTLPVGSIPGGGELSTTVNMPRLLATNQEIPNRSSAAWKLVLEATLRATVRALYDPNISPEAIGTVGIIRNDNTQALAWAKRIQDKEHCVRVFSQDDPIVEEHAVFRQISRIVDDIHTASNISVGAHLVASNRLNLLEAFFNRQTGEQQPKPDSGHPDNMQYDPTDPLEFQLRLLASHLRLGKKSVDPRILERLALLGPAEFDPLGPPPIAEMFSLGEKPDDQSTG